MSACWTQVLNNYSYDESSSFYFYFSSVSLRKNLPSDAIHEFGHLFRNERLFKSVTPYEENKWKTTSVQGKDPKIHKTMCTFLPFL